MTLWVMVRTAPRGYCVLDRAVWDCRLRLREQARRQARPRM